LSRAASVDIITSERYLYKADKKQTSYST